MTVSKSEAETKQTKDDHFTPRYVIWPLLPVLIIVFGHELDRAFNLYLFLVFILFAALVIAAVPMLSYLVVHLVRREWRQALSVVFAPAIAIAPFYMLWVLGVSNDDVIFKLTKHKYVAEVQKIERVDGEPRFIHFKWGETGGAGVANIFETLVFDESGEIALPYAKRSSEWRERVGKLCPGKTICSILTQHTNYSLTAKNLGGHFYLVTEIYQ